MRRLGRRDLPVGAALTIAALVLLASVVSGNEDSRAPVRVEPVAAPSSNAPSGDLDLGQLKRLRKEDDATPPDLFAPRQPPIALAAPQPAPKPSPPPAPSAPPLPFKYLGRMVDGPRTVVFLERNLESLVAAAGDTLDGVYRIESVGETAVHFVYLPLEQKQSLSIPPSH